MKPKFETLKLFDIPTNQRPRERLMDLGSEALSDSEILSLIIRSGGSKLSVNRLSEDIMNQFRTFKGLLEADLSELISFRSIGFAKAASIKAACELGLRLSVSEDINPQISNPAKVYEYLKANLYGKNKEYLYILCLDSRLKLISKELISIGTVNETLIHPREVFSIALKKNAVSIILVHNHPSNDPTPSDADIDLTKRIVESGKILGIKIQDHIIICDNRYYSFRENNLF